MSADANKRAAAAAAIEYVRPEMVLGLGTGSTAAHFVSLLGEKVRAGLSVSAIATSKVTHTLATEAGVTMVEPDETTQIDLAVDGADEVDQNLQLIKGGGGALLREKIIADAAHEFIVIADGSKNVAQLGAFPLPVEIEPFAWALTIQKLRTQLSALDHPNAEIALRADEAGAFVTDGGNLIADCALERISDAPHLNASIREIPGVIETGLFINEADRVIIADNDGVRTLTR